SRPTKLLATEDGGKTWKWVNGPGSASQMIFQSLQDGSMTSYWWPDRLYVTHDGCKTWKEVSLSVPPQVGAATYRTVRAPPVFEEPPEGVCRAELLGTSRHSIEARYIFHGRQRPNLASAQGVGRG